MPQCRYCHRHYDRSAWVESGLRPSEVPANTCPTCHYGVSDLKQIGRNIVDFGKDVWDALKHRHDDTEHFDTSENSRCDSHQEEECQESEVNKVRGAHKREDGTIVVTGTLKIADFYDEEVDDENLSCKIDGVTIEILPNGRLVIESSQCEFIGLDIKCVPSNGDDSSSNDKPIIEVRGALQIHNCDIVGDGHRPLIGGRGAILISNCRISSFTSKSRVRGIIASLGTDDVDVFDTTFEKCTARGTLISAKGAVLVHNSKFRSCECEGVLATTVAKRTLEGCSHEKCRFKQSDEIGISAKSFVTIIRDFFRVHGYPDAFSVKNVEHIILQLQETNILSVDKDKAWIEIFSHYKRIPNKVDDRTMPRICECLWLLACLYVAKCRVKKIKQLTHLFEVMRKYRDASAFWGKEIEGYFCEVMSVHRLQYLDDMPAAVREAILR